MAAAAGIDLLAFLPNLSGGGAERVVLQLLGDFAQRGVRCELAVAAPGGELAGALPAAVPLVCLGRGKPLRAAVALRRHVQRRRPRALLASVLNANLAAVLALRGLRAKPRCVLRESSTLTHALKASPTPARARAAARLLYPLADDVIALTDIAARDLEGFGVPATRIHVIPNPPLGDATGAGGGPPPPAGPYVLACGRLAPEKDYAMLVRAFARVAPAHPGVALAILGEGGERPALVALARRLGIAERVLLPGFVPQPVDWYRRAAAFAHTALFEGFPNAVIDAVRARIPIVAVDSPGSVRMLLDDGRFGTLVRPGDEGAFAQALGAILAGAAALADPTAHLARFDRGTIVQQYLDVLFPAAAPAGP